MNSAQTDGARNIFEGLKYIRGGPRAEVMSEDSVDVNCSELCNNLSLSSVHIFFCSISIL